MPPPRRARPGARARSSPRRSPPAAAAAATSLRETTGSRRSSGTARTSSWETRTREVAPQAGHSKCESSPPWRGSAARRAWWRACACWRPTSAAPSASRALARASSPASPPGSRPGLQIGDPEPAVGQLADPIGGADQHQAEIGELQRLAGDLDPAVAAGGRELRAVAGVQGERHRLGPLGRGVLPVHRLLGVEQDLDQGPGRLVGRDRGAGEARPIEGRGAGVHRGAEVRGAGLRHPAPEQVLRLPAGRRSGGRAPPPAGRSRSADRSPRLATRR